MRTKTASMKNQECTDVPRASIKEKMPARVKIRDNGNYDIQVAGQSIWNIAPSQAKEIYESLGSLFHA